MQVDFYHLVASPLESVLPRIAERIVEGGGRLLIVSADDVRLARLDAHLWSYAPTSFLPHSRAGAGDDGAQPILLAPPGPGAANDARNIALIDGEWRDEALAFDRAFHFFDEEGILAARLAWKALGDREGVERRYWKQDDDGKWSRFA